MKILKNRIISLLLILLFLLSFSSIAGARSTEADIDGTAVIEYAKGHLGAPYVHGAHGPNAFDCSGFVYFIFQHFGIELSTSSSDYFSNPKHFGKVISEKDAKKGDIISWRGHVGIYLGKGKVIHALNSRTGVCITNIEDFRNRYGQSNPKHRYIRITSVAEKINISTANLPKSYKLEDGEYYFVLGKSYICEKNGNLCLGEEGEDQNRWKVKKADGGFAIQNTKTGHYWAIDEENNAVLTTAGRNAAKLNAFGQKKIVFGADGSFLALDESGLNLSFCQNEAKNAAKFKVKKAEILKIDDKYEPTFLAKNDILPFEV